LLEIIVKPTSDKPNSLTQWASALREFMSISRAVSKWLLFARHMFGMVKLKSSERRMVMQFALLIYEAPEAFAARESDGTDPYTGAWRAYYKSVVEAGVYIGGDPLEGPETGTTVRIKDGKRRVQDGPNPDAKEQLGGFMILELPSLDHALDWGARCPAASGGAVEIRPLSPRFKDKVKG
jgi:hypothetical protein